MNKLKDILGLRLKTARIAAGYKTAKSFAEKANVPMTTYMQHESGKRAMNIEALLYYCDQLNIDLDWLVFGGEKPYITRKKQESLLVTAAKTIKELSPPTFDKQIQRDQAQNSIDIKLYNRIVTKLLEVGSELDMPPVDAVDFCIDIYNNVINTSSDDEIKDQMIKLSITSLLKGNQEQSTRRSNIKYK